MKILLAVDGSDDTKRMPGILAAHDELLSAHNDPTALTVVPPIPSHGSVATGVLARCSVPLLRVR